jgi:ABC-type uncharacterized transport system YnjBCD permease subunit
MVAMLLCALSAGKVGLRLLLLHLERKHMPNSESVTRFSTLLVVYHMLLFPLLGVVAGCVICFFRSLTL